MESIVGEISSLILRGLGANSGGGAALGVGVMRLKMIFRERTTPPPKRPGTGSPTIAVVFDAIQQLSSPSRARNSNFGQGSGKIRLPITQLAISLRKEVA